MLHPLPDAVPDRGASLHEPVSIACHGILRAPPHDGDPVLIVGAGIIGLATRGRAEGPLSRVPGHGARPARSTRPTAAAACGADHVVRTDADERALRGARRGSRARASSAARPNVMLMGGFPYVVEAVGAPQSVTEALRAVAHRGTVLLLGAAGVSEVDLTPVWYKEAALVGSIDHTVDAGSAPGLAGGARPSLRRPRARRPRGRARCPTTSS